MPNSKTPARRVKNARVVIVRIVARAVTVAVIVDPVVLAVAVAAIVLRAVTAAVMVADVRPSQTTTTAPPPNSPPPSSRATATKHKVLERTTEKGLPKGGPFFCSGGLVGTKARNEAFQQSPSLLKRRQKYTENRSVAVMRNNCHAIKMYCVKLGLASLLLWAPAAYACSPANPDVPKPSLKEIQAEATWIIRKSVAIIDAAVIRPNGYKRTGEIPALLRVSRVIKGPKQAAYLVYSEASSCDYVFERKDERARVLLETRTLPDGSKQWYASSRLNSSLYAKAVDHLLRFARPVDARWPDLIPPSYDPNDH